MATAHEFDESGASAPGSVTGEGRPVDLVHLARQTLGNRDLEREVLALFRTQSLLYLERLRAAADERSWLEAAHTLKGSARGIGAWQVAKAAEAAEKGRTGAERVIARLARSVDDANQFIGEVMGER